jgi:aryl-alcohol dehydrogenase-like predicted oxidoreductase
MILKTEVYKGRICLEYVSLGDTNIIVSKICFGGLTVGPLQANLSVPEGSEVMKKAFSMGINFIDTAELYETYLHIQKALKETKTDVVISTKSYAYDKITAKKSLEKARKELDRDIIDIFMLHEQESEYTLKGHWEALEYYLECKQKGIIRAVGISTHHVAAVKAANKYKEIEIIHPIVNYRGLGIVDGTIEEMLTEIKVAHSKGKGVFAMKPLGGGNLINDYNKSLDFVRLKSYIHSIALGMQSIEEVIANINYFENKDTDKKVLESLKKQRRKLHIDKWCEGCGKCISSCKQHALYLNNGRVNVYQNKCILCGYCSVKCDLFAIKIV